MQDDAKNMIFSGMQFRKDFGADNCYLIEDSYLHKQSLSSYGFKAVEFVLYISSNSNESSKLIFVEAKIKIKPPENAKKFSDEIADISQKFIDSLQIICGIWHGGCKDKTPIPANFAHYREYGKKIILVFLE